MTQDVFFKLMAIFLTVALGYVAARARWLGEPGGGSDPAKVLSAATFYLFVPALLFRTMVRLDLAEMPGRTVAAYFVPSLLYMLGVYWMSRRHAAREGAAAPATRAITATYGNAVQLGIPMSAAIFGETGLALHVTMVSVHGLILLTVLTVLVEIDLARQDRGATLVSTLKTTVRNTVIHPVVLPVLAGLLWNLTGWGLHPVVDLTLAGLGSAVVPVCLVLIGVSLATYGMAVSLRRVATLTLLKLFLMPAVVLAVAHWGFGLTGMPLGVLVMMAALPAGSNALIFAQRYDTLKAEVSATIMVGTGVFVFTAAFWLAVLGYVAR